MDVQAEKVHETVAAIHAEGGEAVLIVGDLTLSGVSAAAVEAAAAAFGGLNTLWCNAGILGPAEIEDIDPTAYDATVVINMTSQSRAVAPHCHICANRMRPPL